MVPWGYFLDVVYIYNELEVKKVIVKLQLDLRSGG